MILLLPSCNGISILLNYGTQKLVFCTEKMVLFDNIYFQNKNINKQLKIKNTQNYLYFNVTSKRFFKQKQKNGVNIAYEQLKWIDLGRWTIHMNRVCSVEFEA